MTRKHDRHPSHLTAPWEVLSALFDRDELSAGEIAGMIAAVRSGSDVTFSLPLKARQVLDRMRTMTLKEIRKLEFSLLADEDNLS